jgi:hypothetical protein
VSKRRCGCPREFIWWANGQPVPFCSTRCFQLAHQYAFGWTPAPPHSHWCSECEEEEWDCDECEAKRGRPPKSPTDRVRRRCEEHLEDPEFQGYEYNGEDYN